MITHRTYNGFTLIELLVVISTLALLLSILVPVLSSAKDRANAVICSSTQRDIFMVHYAYFTENDQLLPISVNDPVMRPWHTFDYVRNRLALASLSQEYKTRRTELQEYKPSYPKKYICPSAKYALKNPEEDLYPLDRSYGLNAHPYFFPVTVRIKLIKQTAENICLADALDWWFNYWECDKYVQYGEIWMGFPTYGTAAFRHSGKANAVYWDGHCGRIAPDELKDQLSLWLGL
jgi:prepilin-type processing-associated H-X9-DG protein/prepilin-type N-terminal cleavage/methylation domain-containing protein